MNGVGGVGRFDAELLIGLGESGVVGGELGGEGAVDGVEIELVPGGEDGGSGERGAGGVEELGGLALTFEGASEEEVAGLGLAGEICAETADLLAAEGGKGVVDVAGAGLAVANESESAHKRDWAS